ncbi:MAG TPA: hypothetical protein VFO39_22550 [Candidatus Sulfotelmatobacter sp.]|nr:hypothetical protein [Candidatus Sulfotelmatobacter sp.]
MATPVRGDDNGIGYGVLGTSIPAVGVKGEGGQPPINVHRIGGTDPASGVYGIHNGDGYGVYGSSAGGVGVHGSSSSSAHPSVEGQHSGGGAGVAGSSTSGAGVSGKSQSGQGVAGDCPNGSGVSGGSNQGIGVWGTSDNPALGSIWGDSQVNTGAGVVGNSTNGYAIWGQSTTDASRLEGGGPYANVGVFGLADRGNGVLGQADIGAAVAGIATDPKGFAGYFSGNVLVTGFLSKGGSNFQIDHPLDPANKYLNHAAVESSEMKNFYDGIAKLDRKGQAIVRLPKWFAAANRDLRYQLTPTGAAAPELHIASAFRQGSFRIAGGRPGRSVCWQVTGVRNDKWARKNSLVVEAPKAPHHRGKFLHPNLHGKKKEDAIAYIAITKPRRANRST